MPKRGAIASVLTGFALVLLLNFKTPSQQGVVLPGTGAAFGAAQSPAASSAPANAGGGSAGTSSGSGGGASAAPSSAPNSGSSSGSAGSGGSTGSASSGGSGSGSNGAAASTAPAAKSSSSSGAVTSPVVQTPYGPVQVQVTFASGKITDVKALQMPTSHFQSLQISNYVAPILRQQALQVQSAQIYGVSGATYTSYGYAESLQAAIDQAHA